MGSAMTRIWSGWLLPIIAKGGGGGELGAELGVPAPL